MAQARCEATATDANTERTSKELKCILTEHKSTVRRLSRHNCHLASHLLRRTMKEVEDRIFTKKSWLITVQSGPMTANTLCWTAATRPMLCDFQTFSSPTWKCYTQQQGLWSSGRDTTNQKRPWFPSGTEHHRKWMFHIQQQEESSDKPSPVQLGLTAALESKMTLEKNSWQWDMTGYTPKHVLTST